MTFRLPVLVAATVALLIIGASVVSAASNRGVASMVTWFEDPAHEADTVVPSSFATQQRGYYSITTQLHLTSLAPGHRYTLWWVIYNEPAACVDGCDISDLDSAMTDGTNPASIGVFFAGSVVTPANGKLQVGTRLLEHAVNGCQTAGPYEAFCNPLIDAAVAEATVILEDHGPAVDGLTVLPQDALGAGCKSYMRFDTVVATYGETGFDCFSPMSIFLP
jgi:hypothetical protein